MFLQGAQRMSHPLVLRLTQRMLLRRTQLMGPQSHPQRSSLVYQCHCASTADARTEQVCSSRSRPWSLRRNAWSGQWELGIQLLQTARTTTSDTAKTTIGARSTSAIATLFSLTLESQMAKTGSAMTKTQTSKLEQRNPGEFTPGTA